MYENALHVSLDSLTKALECLWTTKLESYYSNKMDMFELYMPHEIVSFKEIENQKFKNEEEKT